MNFPRYCGHTEKPPIIEAFRCVHNTGGSSLGTLLGGGGQSEAAAINNNNKIVGWSSSPNGTTRGFLYDLAFASMQDLGSFTSTASSSASDIDYKNVVVGTARNGSADVAAAWIQNQLIDLNDQIPAATGWVLQSATAINQAGQILGHGTLNGAAAIFRLDPTGPDLDEDGWFTPVDCNDNDPTSYPGGVEIPNDGVDDNIYGIRLDRNGNSIGTDFPVSTASGHQQRVFVKAGGGGYLVLWHDLRNYAASGSDIYGVWVDGSGAVGTEMAVCSCPMDQWMPTAEYDPATNSFLAAWVDGRGSGSGVEAFDVWGAVIPAGGSGSITPFGMVAQAGAQRRPQIGREEGSGQYYMV